MRLKPQHFLLLILASKHAVVKLFVFRFAFLPISLSYHEVKMNIYEDYGLPFTQLPNVICDALLQELTGSEFKVLVYLFRKTFGYHKTEDTISESQFLRGTKNKKEEQVDYGAGVTESTLKNCLRKLASKGYILVTRHNNKPATYTIAIEKLQTLTESESRQQKPQLQTGEVIKTSRQIFSYSPEDLVQTGVTCEAYRVLPEEKPTQEADKTVNTHQSEQIDEALELKGVGAVNVTTRSKKYVKGDKIYPPKGEKEGQVLSPTKGKTHEKIININHAQKEKEEVIQLLLKELHLSTSEAQAYTELILFTHKRDLSYVSNLISYLFSNPKIRYPAAAFRKLVQKNEVRFPITSKEKPASLHKVISSERLKALAEKVTGNSRLPEISTDFAENEYEDLIAQSEDYMPDCRDCLNSTKASVCDDLPAKITQDITNPASLAEFLVSQGILGVKGIHERLSFWLDSLVIPFAMLCEFAQAASLAAPGSKSFTFTRQVEIWQATNYISNQTQCTLVAS